MDIDPSSEDGSVWQVLGIPDTDGKRLVAEAMGAVLAHDRQTDILDFLFPDATAVQKAKIYAYAVAFAQEKLAHAMPKLLMAALRGREG